MIKVSEIFQKHMIIQRDKPCKVWGTASPEEKVQITIAERVISTQADYMGNWELILPSLPVMENVTMTICGIDSEICIEDIAVGEVWIAGGQSNMEFYMRYEQHMKEEKKICSNSRIRMFDVPEISYAGQKKDFDYSRMGIWRKADEKNLEYFSAVAYYFAKELEKNLQVPIGIIGCNWGGTSSSVWMSAKSAVKYAQPWVEAYNHKFSKIDMDEYWENQKTNFLNNRGCPFEDSFSELVLPKTVSAEVIKRFFTEMNSEDAKKLQMPQPQSIPGCLYEHMVKTIAPYTVSGVLWYQGESDDELEESHQEQYGKRLKALMADWRELWNDSEMPFLIVQLPGWKDWIWSKAKGFETIRRCQQEVVDLDPKAWICSISDAGEEHDIHPKNKKIVGDRLSLLALGHIYEKAVECDPPRIEEIKRIENDICIKFANTYGGLIIQGEKINALSVTSEENEISFEEEIQGEYLWIHMPKDFKETLIKVDFAQTQWFRVNLYNKAKIPAIPFSFEC